MLQRVVTPQTGIQHSEENCKININSNDKGSGTLYISEDRLIWENQEHRGLSLGYRDIAIHAISKDLQAFPEECLYVMYNGEIAGAPAVNGDGNAGSDEDSESSEHDSSGIISEIRFVPGCKDNLEKMFDAMNACQCLHPDSEDSDDYYGGDGDHETEDNQELEGAVYSPTTYEDGAGEGFYTSEEGFQHLTPAGRVTLERLNNMLAHSQISQTQTEGVSQMDGVIIEDDDIPDPDEPPVVGRPPVVEEEMNDEPIEGQFEDAE